MSDEVIKWAVIGGVLVFALGLVSAFGSRYQERKARDAQAVSLKGQFPMKHTATTIAPAVVVQKIVVSKNETGSAAAAIYGVKNGEDERASFSNIAG